jgi:hypothetical protein
LVIARYPLTGRPPTLEEHLAQAVAAGAAALLTGLAYRPERFLRLAHRDRRTAAGCLEIGLGAALPAYLDMLADAGHPGALSFLHDNAYRLNRPPEPQTLREFCAALRGARTAAPRQSAGPAGDFDALIRTLLGALGFERVFLMLDGADGFFETSADPAACLAWIEPLLALASDLSGRGVALKAFLPSEVEPLFQERFGEPGGFAGMTRIEWTAGLLAEMLRRRVYVASLGRYDSLDALAAPDLRDVELLLAEAGGPLPRRVLKLTRAMLAAYQGRLSGRAGQLARADFEAAVAAHRGERYPSYANATHGVQPTPHRAAKDPRRRRK